MPHHHSDDFFDVETNPYLEYNRDRGDIVSSLVELSDGSFVSCHHDKTAKRWVISKNDDDGDDNEQIQLVGTFVGQQNFSCILETDDDTFLSGSIDGTLRVWNKTTGQCLDSQCLFSEVWSLALTTDKKCVLCGLGDGKIDTRRLSGSGLVYSFEFHSKRVRCIIGLEDGNSYVSASDDNTMKRWDGQGRTLQTFLGHTQAILQVIELRRDILVSGSCDYTAKLWSVSSGECLRTVAYQGWRCGLVKLSEERFISVGPNETLEVWNDSGDHFRDIKLKDGVRSMIRLSRTRSILTAGKFKFEIRRLLRYKSSSFFRNLCDTAHIDVKHTQEAD